MYLTERRSGCLDAANISGFYSFRIAIGNEIIVKRLPLIKNLFSFNFIIDTAIDIYTQDFLNGE